jgi:hypothetical protein
MNMAKVLFFIIALTILLSGCALIKPEPQTAEETSAREKALELERARDSAAQRYRYQALRDELIVEKPVLSADQVSPGGQLNQETRYVVLSPDRKKLFKVLEVTVLSGPGILIELSRKETEKSQGTHVSTLQLTIPNDLPLGLYTLVTTISTPEQSFKRTVTFQVIR